MSAKTSFVSKRRISTNLVMVLFASVVCARTSQLGSEPSLQLPTRFGIEDRAPDFTVFENLVQNFGAFHRVVTGDFNGDGVGDLLITNSLALQGGAARAYIILGKKSLGSPASIDLAIEQPDFTILGPGERSQLGFSAAVGDLNGDGKDDIILSARVVTELGRSTWAIYVIFGSQAFSTRVVDLANVPADVIIVGKGGEDIGIGLAVGDINGDGANDLMFGRPGAGRASVSILLGPFAAGAVFDLATAVPDITMTGRAILDLFGYAIALGDVNGDGISDLVIGSPGIVRDQGLDDGAVDIFTGSSAFKKGVSISLSEGRSHATILGAFGGVDYGFGDQVGKVISIGDVNADGINDILLGVPNSTRVGNGLGPTSAGETYVVLGSQSLPGRFIDIRQGQQDLTIQGAAATETGSTDLGDSLGASIIARDIDGDGVADILIGAPGCGGSRDYGAAYVVLGSSELMSGGLIKISESDQDVTILGDQKRGYLGTVVASGDLNGDGISDLILEAPGAQRSDNQQASGAIYVYFGANVRPPEITKAKFKEGKSLLQIFGADFTGDVRVEINGMIINRDLTFFPDEGRLVVKGTRQELNLDSDTNHVVVMRKGTRSNIARVKG